MHISQRVALASEPVETRFADYQKQLKSVLQTFETFFQGQLTTFEPELKEVISAVLRHPGKRLRPGFVFACAQIFENPSPRALRMASIVEFIHLATLVHDDILDNAALRHGVPAHHLVFDAKTSVLTGDTLFLRANELSAMEDDPWLGRVVSAAAKATCSGEIMQGLRRRGSLSRQEYEKQLLLKTGKLFGLSCSLGGFLAGMGEAERARLAAYGENFGVAYQLYDDAVDVWGAEADYKKTLGTDQTQRKQTLPWILLAGRVGEVALEPLWKDRAAALSAFKAHGIFEQATNIFEETLQKASGAVKGLPQEKLLGAPLEYVREKWQELA